MGITDILSKIKDGGDQTTGDVAAINSKIQGIQAYKNATAPQAAPAKVVGTPINRNAKYGDKTGEKRINTTNMTKPLGSFKKGGKVKKTGVYKLHAKERVLNAKQTSKVEKAGGFTKVLAGK